MTTILWVITNEGDPLPTEGPLAGERALGRSRMKFATT